MNVSASPLAQISIHLSVHVSLYTRKASTYQYDDNEVNH